MQVNVLASINKKKVIHPSLSEPLAKHLVPEKKATSNI